MSKRSSARKRRVRFIAVNAAALVVAVASLAYSLSIAPPAQMAASAKRLMADASVSMSASVPANPYNTLAAQLTQKQNALDARAAQLEAQQATINSRDAIIQDLGLAGFGLSIFLLILVGLNFYLDGRRRRDMDMGPLARKFLVDLRS